MLLGAAQIPAAYLIGARMFSRRAALIAAVLVACSPSLVYHSILVRPYSLLPLLALISSYYLWCSLKDPSRRTWLGYGLSMLMMLYTHNWTVILLAAHWVVAWTWFARFRGPGRAVRGWFLTQAGLALGFSPWLPVFLSQVRLAGHAPYIVNSLFAVTYAATLLNSVLSPFHNLTMSAILAMLLCMAAVWEYRHGSSVPIRAQANGQEPS